MIIGQITGYSDMKKYTPKPEKKRKTTWKDNRSLKVYEALGEFTKTAPRILMQGKWLEQAGFGIGDRITVHCEMGRLTITKDGPEDTGNGEQTEAAVI